MVYGAFTFDTTAAKENGYRFDSGLLGQLKQFEDSPVQIVMSEVVMREILRHILEPLSQTLLELNAKLENAQKKDLLTDGGYQEVKSILKNQPSPAVIAEERIALFEEGTGAIVVTVDGVSVRSLIDDYFSFVPPFEDRKDKKHEFPDAIALRSLEQWAKENGKKLLAVSNDKGWAAYAAESEWIDVESDLAAAIETMLGDIEQLPMEFGQKALSKISHDENSQPHQFFYSEIAYRVAEIDVLPEAAADFYYDWDFPEIHFEGFEFLRTDDGYDFHVVRSGTDEIVINAGISINATIHCSFDLSVKDGIDKDFIKIGSSNATIQETFDASVLLTFAGDLTGVDYELICVELLDTPHYFDFGYIQPDDSFYD